VSPEDVRELFRVLGPVEVRRLFGGAGILADGVMLALMREGVIYLKVDAGNVSAFDAEGLGPFSYLRRGEPAALTSYRRMPDRLYDDPEELAIWARASLAAARRNAVQRRRKAAARRRS
jgi:DNA transformation protein